MAAKTKNHRHTQTNQTHQPLNAMADEARKNYEHAVRTGQKFQEDAGQWWTRLLGQALTAGDWQKQVNRLTAITSCALPLAQKRLEEAMHLVETNSRTGTELMKKAVDAVQSPSLAESQAKWMDFWSSSMKAAQSNVEAATEFSTRAVDTWIEFVRKNADLAEAQVSRQA